MIKLYGNEIWNSNTPNQYKKVIIASESQFESITDALENAGLNYCGYINKNKSYVAVGRATVPNLEKLNISYDSIVDSNNRKYVTNNIIGTTKYNDIGDKMYRKYNTDFAYKVAQRLSEQDIPFSGRIFGKNTTITVDNIYKDAINAIAHEIREQRELLYNDKAVEKNEPSATVKNSVTVSKEDNTENLFNALSVLHYKAHQLESLNSTVELLNNQPELIDTFSTMFEDTSDFKPEQLNMLSMNFVKTYSGLSDSELILANTADFNEIKQSFINTNLADKLIENHGYSYAQSELIRDMVDMGIDYDTINLLDYTFSLTEMQTFIGAYSRSDYDSLINLVSKVKGVTRSEVEGMISDGTYTPALPDFNTLEKTLYFQESEAESITYMYYNPDAYSGGQFVITEVSYKQIAEANKEYGDDFSGFFDFLDTTGEQRLIDIGSESFRTAVKKFYSGTEFAEGLNADIQHKLVELAVVPEIKLPEVRKIELIKVGDFYEVRGENAKTVADILDLVSTTRNINGSSVDTVGFPDFKLNDNTELLKTQGFTVNIKYEGLVDLSNEFNKLISEQKKITSNVSDKHTIVINAFAGPGAGKTTSCLEVAEKLKKQGFVTEYVQEYAKELVYDNNLIMLDGHYEHQFDILKEQVKRINRLYGKVDFILTDSPVLLNNTYLNEDKGTNDYVTYCENVKKIYTLYDNFNYFVERDKSAFEEEGRIHNLEQSIVIDDELKNTLHNNQIDFATYTHSTIDNIVRDSVLAYAKQLINLYCNDEFDSEADFSDLKKVGVAYTTTEDSKHTVEAVVNLVDYRLETYVDDKLFKEKTYSSLKDMIDNCLYSLSFDDLVYLSDDELAMQLENDEKSASEKSSVGKNNFIWTSADEHAPVTSQPTLFDSMPVSDVSSDETTSHENYVLEDRESVTGAKTKYRNNITAIKVLKQIEAEYRTATPEEQKQLSLYSGWGGLANAFESDNDKWKNEYSELKELLTDDEYTAARSSVLDAFFTDSVIIDSIYKVMQNAGFKGGNILEPAMGIGNFFGRLPSELRENSKLYGVEKDSLSGRIAQKLYPQADITIDGFENTHFQDNSFDVAIGNIPFGDFGVIDKKYSSQNLKIHDYFFVKSLDKVRDGGVVAFVTSKGTLDKKDSSFRRALAEKADLVGAVRLPNNAFKSEGTEVTPDIIFLQKRAAPLENIPSWVNVGTTENSLSINNYFIEHPEMVLGDIVQGNKLYGRTDDTMCVPFADGRPLSELLPEAVKNIVFTYSPAKEVISPVSKTEAVISKPEGLRSQSYYKSGNEIYFYGSNSAGELVTVSAKDLLDKKYTTKNIDRLTAFMEIRDTLRELLEVQQHDNNDAEVEQLQHRLNTIYDNFYDKYGLIHSRYNRNILGFDGAYQLVASLEQDYDKNTLIKKSDIFTQRVNVPKPQIEHIDTASEALAVCIAKKGYIDFDYMSNLTDIDKASLEESLRNNGEIYPIPMNTENNEYTYQTASEYLSGDIYAKLDTAESYAAVDNNIYRANVTALKAALPTPLKAGDIDVNLGATWIAPEYYEQFMYKLFETPLFNRSDGIFKDSKISVEYSEYSGKWFISHKAADKSVTVTKTYGACGYSGYQILEAALNLSEPKVYKDKLDEYGRIMFDKNNKPIRVIDVPATQVVQQKANKIRREFKNWLFSDPVRRSDIVDTYNRTFNCIKPREYDGSHLTFPGMNSNIELHEHQKNAIAHAIYGGNTLFAHSVGAGKTFEMIATAMECKRLGLCHKSLFAVPNHLTEQVGADFLKLYPNANILVATKDDFKAENRKRLMSKIATGNYDAVIIGHTQLKMLPLSPERQENIFKEQIDNIVAGIAELKYQEGNSFKVKDMERTKRSLEQQLEKLQSSKKDNTVYFEELGIDKLFVDEAHEFKNLFCTTKLQNVSGISSRASQRATELFAKCRYLDEKTGGKGVVFATGTPLSNSVTELHTMMRYLNYDFLASHNNMQNFDNWVSTFGVQKKEYELAPAGNKFKERTRIAEYANLPELMSMFKTIADVRTADTLNLKVPDCELHIVDVEPTELQTELVEELSDRADEVNNGSVDPSQDNMLKITGDGRKLGLDPRLINPSFEDDPGTKLNVCVNNVFDIYEKTSDKKLTQIVFCDLGVPSKNSSADGNKDDDTKSVAELDSLEESGKFCVYDDIRDKLIAKGVSADEIAYIHNAKSETQKSELFAKVRSGEVRILLGSTGKMGTGTNVQDRIIALHDLDVPWRPSDLEQRRGRMVRQGNINDKVHLYRYVTKGTFDTYSYQLLEKKQKFISQIMTSKEPGRKCADVDQAALTYSEIKALCTGDERIREKLTLENRVKELQALKSEYNSTRYELEDKVNAYPEERKKLLLDIGNISKDMETVKNIPFDVKTESYRVKITIGKDAYSLLDDESRKVAAKALTNAVAQVKGDANKNKRIAIGGLGNFGVEIINDGYFFDKITATLRGNYTYSVELGVSSIINLKKIENLLFKVENVLNDKKSELNKLDIDYKTAQNMLHKPFEFEDELNNSTKRLDELTTALNIDMSEHKVDKPKKTHYFGKDFILGKNKSSKQIQNNEVMKSEPKRSEQEL